MSTFNLDKSVPAKITIMIAYTVYRTDAIIHVSPGDGNNPNVPTRFNP
jgi:hypothetical protein